MAQSETLFPPKRQIRILVVEDSPDDFDLLVAALQRQGLQVDCVRVEDEAGMSRALANQEFDAVISDHDLPRFSSGEALRTLQQSGLTLPFLIVSGTIGEDIAVEAMRLGADDFLIKGRLARLGPALTNAMRAADARRARAHAEEALRESETRLRSLSVHLQHLVDEERKAIAREIHDEIGGTLSGLRFDLSWIERNGDAGSRAKAHQALASLSEAQQATQRIMRNLRPPVLDAGLVPALEWQIGEFRRRTGATVHFRSNLENIEADDRVAMTVYRTLQEALTNIVKHAQARTVDVDLVVHDGFLSMEILDDGRGITPEDQRKLRSHGLRGLAERAQDCGGWFEVSSLNPGTALLLSVPLDPDAPSAEPDPA